MATIAVGDIHGNRPALNDILDQIRGEVSGGDTIVFLGDYIDRGPDTRGCVDTILALQREVKAEISGYFRVRVTSCLGPTSDTTCSRRRRA